jgi:hypothetical protein
MNEPIGSWGWLSAYDDTVWGPEWEFNQGTRVNTAPYAGQCPQSLVTTGSQVTSLTSHPKDGTLRRAMSPIPALGHWDIFLDQRKECLLLVPQHHFQQHLVSHTGTDQDQPCLVLKATLYIGTQVLYKNTKRRLKMNGKSLLSNLTLTCLLDKRTE